MVSTSPLITTTGAVLLSLFLYVGFAVLVVYLMISAIRFFKHKTQNDREIIQKLDEIIRLHSQSEKAE